MSTTSTDRFEVEYYGKAAHAAAAPWEGVNAQDALILAYNALLMLLEGVVPLGVALAPLSVLLLSV